MEVYILNLIKRVLKKISPISTFKPRLIQIELSVV